MVVRPSKPTKQSRAGESALISTCRGYPLPPAALARAIRTNIRSALVLSNQLLPLEMSLPSDGRVRITVEAMQGFYPMKVQTTIGAQALAMRAAYQALAVGGVSAPPGLGSMRSPDKLHVWQQPKPEPGMQLPAFGSGIPNGSRGPVPMKR